MQNNDINFINYTPKKKGNVKYLITAVVIMNIFLIGNFIVVFSDICKNFIDIRNGEYERVTGDVIEATYFSDTSSSLKVKYKYFDKIAENRVISNKYYKEGSKVELLINRSNNTDISVISLESTYETIEWVMLIAIIFDIILLFSAIVKIKNKNLSRI